MEFWSRVSEARLVVSGREGGAPEQAQGFKGQGTASAAAAFMDGE